MAMSTSDNMTPESESAFEALLDYLKRSRGFDFTGYKRASLMRRINKQMSSVQVETYADYMSYLEANPDEVTRLLSTLLINVTSFFRDPPVWEMVQQQLLPTLIAERADDQPLRLWSAGSASGEEAYTLTLLLAEALGMENLSRRVKVYATDIDEDALAQGRAASFSAQEVVGIPPNLLAKYFDNVRGRYQINKELRRAVIFGQHNLVQDVPITHLDMLVCRNTLMYFNVDVQTKILARFHFALNEGAFLILGKAETLLINSHLFTPIDLKRRVFIKTNGGPGRPRTPGLMGNADMDTSKFAGVGVSRFADAALDASPVAQIVLDSRNLLALANERARALFRLTQRDIGRPFQDMELSYRPVELRSFIEKVTQERYPVVLKEILSRTNGEGDVSFFDVQIAPLAPDDGEPTGISITFLEVTRYKRLQEELETSNLELGAAYEEAQSAAEELETTNEELQASAEELETTNEELQSTNEEMETMNEELQSANEELQTMNDELRQRSAELSDITEFMESILSSLRGGTAVLNTDLKLQTWNRQAEDLWGLRSDEVMGKHLLSLDIGLPVDRLLPTLRAILNGTSSYEEATLPATNRRGRAIQCRVSIMPLLNRDQAIQGVVMIMQDTDIGSGAQDANG